MGLMEKVMHKAEEQIKKKMQSGNQQQQPGGYVTLPLFSLIDLFILEGHRHRNNNIMEVVGCWEWVVVINHSNMEGLEVGIIINSNNTVVGLEVLVVPEDNMGDNMVVDLEVTKEEEDLVDIKADQADLAGIMAGEDLVVITEAVEEEDLVDGRFSFDVI
ncbi:hypothetical protein ACEPPN_003305 [Leptodophora sp. 'Broadleaf-Isolate-01']